MRKEFLEKLIERFPNDQELGAAIRYYFKLINLEGFNFIMVEEIVLNKNFQL
jgi:hypothetical protein